MMSTGVPSNITDDSIIIHVQNTKTLAAQSSMTAISNYIIITSVPLLVHVRLCCLSLNKHYSPLAFQVLH